MIKHYVQQWEENKDKLEVVFKNNPVPPNYAEIVKLLFTHVLKETDKNYFDGHDIKKMKEINDGEWQGTLIFIIPYKTYQPSVSEYIFTSVGYGSCSGCDTLQNIDYNYGEGIADERQVKDLMMLALHLVQNIKYLDGREE